MYRINVLYFCTSWNLTISNFIKNIYIYILVMLFWTLLHIAIYLLHSSAALTWSLCFHPKSPTASRSSPEIFNHYLISSYPKTHSLSFSKYSSHLRWLSFYHWHNNSPKVLAWNLGVMPDFILNHSLYRH